MKKSEIKKALGELDKIPMPKLFDAPAKEKRVKKSGVRRSIIMAAAVLAVLAALVGCAAEVKEYNDAVTFFEEHELSRENLSRNDIKKVYRDIITEKFKLEQTAVVIIDSYEGSAIGIAKPTSEELKNIWESFNSNISETYSWYYLDNDAEMYGIMRSGEMMFKKEENGVVLWETKIPLRDGYVEGYTLLSDGKYIAVYGVYSPIIAPSQSCGFVEIFDEKSGESLLQKLFLTYNRFSIAEIIPEGDEMVIFARAELKRFVFIRMDLDGEILYQKETEIGNKGIWNVAPFGDGYIVQIGGYQLQEAIYKVSRDGEIGEGISYSSEDEAYFICDMLDFGGKLYLSAYAVPKHGRDIGTPHDEISYIIESIWKNPDDMEIATEETSASSSGINGYGIYMNTENLLEDVQNNYTAVLLVCDGEDRLPKNFYSVEGSVCGELSVSENGEMLWETEYISEAYYSPATSSFSIGGACIVYRHSFDADGSLVKTEKTGEVTGFRR